MSLGTWLLGWDLGCLSNQEATVAFKNKSLVVKGNRHFLGAPTKWTLCAHGSVKGEVR